MIFQFVYQTQKQEPKSGTTPMTSTPTMTCTMPL